MSLQLRHLEACPPHEISDALESLPTGLDETYYGILERFRPNRSSLPRVRFVLGFIAFARRPLTVNEVAAALSFDLLTMKVDCSEDRTTVKEAHLLRMLPGLINIVDSDSERIVQFIHFSVKEYLTSDNLHHDKSVGGYYLDRYCADTSIATLAIASFDPENEPALGNLKEYAKKYWADHTPSDIRDGNVKPNTSDRPDAAEQRDAAERLNSALDAFLHPGSLAFKSWKVSVAWAATPLHVAVGFGLLGQVMRLLAQGAECNAFADGVTPLYSSVLTRAYPCTDTLLKRGADSNLTQRDGFTPLHLAAYNGDATAVRALLGAGADIWARATLQTRSHIGESPLHLAVHYDQTDICKLLLGWADSGGLGDVPDWRGQTPLHYAARLNKPGNLEILLENGANACAVDAFGNTSLTLARHEGAEQCVKLLEEHLNKTSSVDEPPPCYSMTRRDPLHPTSTPNLTLHVFLRPKVPTSSADEAKQPSPITFSVNMGWSCNDRRSGHSDFMLTLTASPDDDKSGSACYAAKAYSINADGSFRSLLQHESSQPFSLSPETQAHCRAAIGATSSSKNSQEHTEEAAPRLLVHLVPASGKISPHSSMSFPLPQLLHNKWEDAGYPQNRFILAQLVTAAEHFQSCCQNVTNSLDLDKSDEQGTVVEPTSPASSNVGVPDAEQNSPSPSSPVDNAEAQQTPPSSSAPAVVERTSNKPIERVAVPPAFPTSLLLLCGVVVTAAVVYVSAVHRNH